jgi:hypothetical protein
MFKEVENCSLKSCPLNGHRLSARLAMSKADFQEFLKNEVKKLNLIYTPEQLKDTSQMPVVEKAPLKDQLDKVKKVREKKEKNLDNFKTQALLDKKPKGVRRKKK